MSEEPKSFWTKSRTGTRSLWLAWLCLMVAICAMSVAIFLAMGTPITRLGEEAVLVATGVICLTIIFCLMLFIRWLCCWRNLKRFLFGLACVGTLIALFYAEENWRGRSAWRNYVRERSGKGEPFEVKDIIPPPVPDDKNFAMAPIVQRFYNYILTTEGKKIPSEVQMTQHVDRLDFDLGENNWETNAGGYWAKGTMSRLDLWQQHYRELATKTNQFAVSPQPQSPAADVLLALSKFDTTVEEIRLAAKLPECRFPLDYDNEDPAAILLPHLAALKQTSRLLQMRALAELENGQSDKAVADVLLTLRLTDCIRNEPTMIGVLVRAAMTDIALQPVYEGLAKHRWTNSQLAAIGDELARQDYLVDYNSALRWERAFSSGIIDYLAKRDTRRRYEELFGLICDDDFRSQQSDDAVELKAWGVALMPMGWLDLNRLAIAQFLERWMLRVADAEKHQVMPAAADDMVWQAQHWHGTPVNFMVKSFVVGLSKGPHRFARMQSTVDLARTAVALEQYRLAQGSYPEALDALAPKYLDKIPGDVIGGQPLKYRREADGQFVLYSVGWNGKDDGGVTGHAEGGDQPNFDFGDWVWRYPE